MKVFKEMFLILAIVVTACNQEVGSQIPEEANLICGDFYAAGQLEHDTYTFCSTTPSKVQYSYKKGAWKYWNLKGDIIASGIFNPVKQKITDQGGCPYEVITGRINHKEWLYWDDHGNKIEPSSDLINKLEKCEVIRTE